MKRGKKSKKKRDVNLERKIRKRPKNYFLFTLVIAIVVIVLVVGTLVYSFFGGFNKITGFSLLNPGFVKCVDSDGGTNHYIRGFTKGFYKESEGNIVFTTKEDRCFNDSRRSWVEEYYCRNYGFYSNGTYNDDVNLYKINLFCLEGCKEGRCTGETAQCVDSDRGRNYYVKGVTSKKNDSRVDYCLTVSFVREYYCSDNNIFSIDSRCSRGCREGSCIR